MIEKGEQVVELLEQAVANALFGGLGARWVDEFFGARLQGGTGAGELG